MSRNLDPLDSPNGTPHSQKDNRKGTHPQLYYSCRSYALQPQRTWQQRTPVLDQEGLEDEQESGDGMAARNNTVEGQDAALIPTNEEPPCGELLSFGIGPEKCSLQTWRLTHRRLIRLLKGKRAHIL